MDDLRLGRLVRVVLQRFPMGQRDLAARAGVSPTWIARQERGHASGMRLRTLRDVGGVLGIRVEIDARWRGGDEGRLLDAGHASLVEAVITVLRRSGREILTEHSFNHFGERGAVDVVGWHPGEQILLIVEVKTKFLDLQNVVGRLGRKVRIVPPLIATQRGWRARHVARLLVVGESSSNRRVVAAHPALFQAEFPVRGAEVRRWLRRPSGGLSGLWFLSGAQTVTVRQRVSRRKAS